MPSQHPFAKQLLLLVAVGLVGCGKSSPEEQYKDDPALAAAIKQRKAKEKAAAEAPPEPYDPKPYDPVTITEKPAGRILFNCYRDRAVTMWGVTIGEQPKPLKSFRSPRWSPDGKQVLVSYFGGQTNRFELGVTEPDGGGVIDVAASSNHDSALGAWSPRGKQIVYVQSKDNSGDIAIINVDGSGARTITPHAKDDTQPAWSPDGQTIAFVSYRDSGSGIYTVPAAGGTAKRITPEKDTADQPVYSPDGNYLAYVVTYRHPTTRDWVRDLRVMKLDNKTQRTLVQAKRQIVGVDWSPKGQWLVIGCEDESQSDLCIVDINGDGFRKITDDPHGDTAPSWQPVAPGANRD